MPMYNLLEYSQNYSVTSGSLGNYYRDEIDDVDANSSEGKSFKYKTKIVGKQKQELIKLEMKGIQIEKINHQYQL